MRTTALLVACLAVLPVLSTAQPADSVVTAIDRTTAEILPQVVGWRRDFHQHPELGMQEARTSKIIAEHLRGLGMEVQTGVAGTGVVGVLKGGRPGKVVALRADMDGLPVTEQVDLPFKSTEKAMWNGQETGVMHACGHDNHIAILMGVATVLSRMRAELPGTVKFIFQPAEEGPGGAEPMVKAGVLENPKVDAVFGLHVFPYTSGTIVYRSGPLMASADEFTIEITGRQTHGAVPVGRRRSDRDRRAAGDVDAVDRVAHGEHRAGASGGDRGQVHGREPLEHHSGQGGAGRNRAGLRPGGAGEDSAAPHRHGHQVRGGGGRDREGDLGAGLPGDDQRSRAHRAHGARRCSAWPVPARRSSVR